MSNFYESMSTSVIRVTRQQKIARLAAGFAMRIAKANGDPLYKKAMRFRKLFWASKKILVKRYGAKGLQAARKAILKSAQKK